MSSSKNHNKMDQLRSTAQASKRDFRRRRVNDEAGYVAVINSNLAIVVTVSKCNLG